MSMKSTTLFTLILALAAPMARAQIEMPLTQPRFTLLVSPQIQEHLKLTDEQKKKIDAALEANVQREGDRVMIMMGPDTDIKELDKAAIASLDDKQKQRLSEIWLQRNGLLALEEKETAKTLDVVEDQMEKIRPIFDDYRQKIMDLFMTHDDNGGEEVKYDRTKVEKLRADTNKKIEAILKEEQVKAWKAMLGEKFEFKEG